MLRPQGQMPLEFAFDVSGTPGDTTYIGMVSLNRLNKDDVLSELFDAYPYCSKVKGRQLRMRDHLDIIRFLDQHGVKMRVLRFTANDWSFLRRTWGGVHELDQKISAVLYFATLSTVAWTNCRYSVITCVESQLGDITRVTHHCRRLARMFDIDLDCYHATDASNRSVKVADFIASSGRTLSPADVSGVSSYRFVERSRIKEWYYRTIFS